MHQDQLSRLADVSREHDRRPGDVTVLDTFVKTYGDRHYRFPVLVNHGGVVVGFAMDELRRIHYTVLDLADATTPMDVDAWLANPVLLTFPSEMIPVGFASTDPTALPQVKLTRGKTYPIELSYVKPGGAKASVDVTHWPEARSTVWLSTANFSASARTKSRSAAVAIPRPRALGATT